MLAVRDEGGGGRCSRTAEAEGSAQEPALTSVRLASVTPHFAVLASIPQWIALGIPLSMPSEKWPK